MKGIYKLLIIIFIIPVQYNATGQEIKPFYDWQVTSSFGYEKNDKRLYEFPLKDMLLAQQPEEWGTYWFNIALQRTLENDLFRFNFGIGYELELQTFSRPISVYPFNDPGDPILFILLFSKNYLLHHIVLPVSYQQKIIKGLTFDLFLNANFSVYKDPRSKSDGSYPMKIRGVDFDFYSLGFFPGLSYKFQRISIGANFRLFKLQKFDRVIYNISLFGGLSNPPDPRLNKVYETYNPTHIRLYLGYSFDL